MGPSVQPRGSSPRRLSCFLLLAASLPTRSVHGFAVSQTGFRPCNSAVQSDSRATSTCYSRKDDSFSRRPIGGSSSLVIMSMGARDGGGNEQDKTDHPREGMEESSSTSGLEDDDPMAAVKARDWRLFRKQLISQYRDESSASEWNDGSWAHEIGRVESGCLLLATEEIWDGPFHQSVILVLSHDQALGTVGLILNRPGPQRLYSLAGLKSDLADVFADSQVFDGGPVGLGTMTVVHATNGAEGSETVSPGVYAGGFDSLVHLTRQGIVDKNRVRFVHGHSAWAPGQLEGELSRNQWFIAAAAPELVTADCDQTSSPLWEKVLRLMGGRYYEVAQRNELT